ncbi:unnamed protein product [Natator depressus]
MASTYKSPSPLSDSVASLLSETPLSTPVPCSPLVPSLEHLISQVPSSLWSTHPSEVGRLHTDAVCITVDSSKPLPRLSQYPLNPEAEAGIAPVMTALQEQGIIIPCSSPCNTPILPVRKADGKLWRFVQDLRAINRIVIPAFPVVPNPVTILTSIPPDATHFTVDLCSLLSRFTLTPSSFLPFLTRGNSTHGPHCPRGILKARHIFPKH